MSVEVKVLGGDKLIRKLTVMPAKAKPQVRASMARQADKIVGMMQRLAPVAKSAESGRRIGALRDSIGWNWGGKLGKASARAAAAMGDTAGTKYDQELRLSIFAGSEEAFYARWVEFGAAKGTVAQPFFYPSWRANRKGATNAIKAAVRKAAKQVAAGG